MFQDSLTKKIAEAASQIKTEPEKVDVNEKSVEGAVEKIMREALIGNQHKIDANKNKKIDAHDFKLLRAQKEKEKANSQKFGKDVKEEIEQIDELKKSTLGSYVKKASKDLAAQSFDHGEDEHRQYGDPEDTERENEMKKRERDIENRQKGISRAATKLSKEEVEELDELSKDSYKNYLSTSKKLVGDHAKGSQLSRYGEYGAKDRELNTKNAQKHAMKKLKEEDEDEKEDKKEMKESAGASKSKEEKFHMSLDKLVHKTFGHSPAEKKEKVKKEETEIKEAKKVLWPGTKEYKAKHGTDKEKHEAKYGKSDVKKLAPYGYRDKSEYEKSKEMKEEVEELDELSKDTLKSYAGKVVDKTRTMPQGAKKQKHLEGLGKAMDKMKEEHSFSTMLESYKEGGLKYIASLVKEEPDNEQFTKEVEEAKRKNKGELRNDKGVAKPLQNASVSEPPVNPVREESEQIEEKTLTEPETAKKEEIVKSMKKKMPGFKERYGERAKSVMYATATKIAKEKA